MKVLSLFDGISCGRLALKRAGIKIDKYYRSEINKHANIVSEKHFPDSINLGDVRSIVNIPDIDLLMGGSPCQGFSLSGKQLNFDDPRSKLFFEFVRLLKSCKPKYFLLENVKMKKEYQDIISEHLGVEPVELNSAKTSAQNRVRLYWANFKISEPSDMGVKLIDILDDSKRLNPAAIRGRRLNKASIIGRRITDRGVRDDYNKKVPITQCLEVRSSRSSDTTKSNCLTTVAKDTVITDMPIGRHLNAFDLKDRWRYYSKAERCKLMNLPDNFCDSISLNQTVKVTGNGWDVSMIGHILKHMSSG